MALGVTACAPHDPDGFAEGLTTSALPNAAKPVHEAQVQFSNGHYGNAIDAFAKTVEIDPHNPDAWLGLAASYDQIGQFDKADKAYARVQELIGATPGVLNNIGYSYFLRGNLEQARRTLQSAQERDPGNPYILNNIDMLNERLAALGKEQLVVR